MWVQFTSGGGQMYPSKVTSGEEKGVGRENEENEMCAKNYGRGLQSENKL